MRELAGTVALALSVGPVLATPASAAMQVGETHPFTMDDPTEGTANYLLKQKFGQRYFVTGGSIKKLADNKFLICGYAIDRLTLNQDDKRPVGFVIISDRTADHAKVMAPLTTDAQESKGCWPGERQRLKAAMEAFEHSVQGGAGQTSSAQPNQ